MKIEKAVEGIVYTVRGDIGSHKNVPIDIEYSGGEQDNELELEFISVARGLTDLSDDEIDLIDEDLWADDQTLSEIISVLVNHYEKTEWKFTRENF